jgi:hypothetical protein
LIAPIVGKRIKEVPLRKNLPLDISSNFPFNWNNRKSSSSITREGVPQV